MRPFTPDPASEDDLLSGAPRGDPAREMIFW
jgi:hypothetical protein